ncbi:hypothetical protein D6D15_10476 [Aureobasidium pullulans]|uniref:Uncharacterized protein n=1 Tax=Aureobasidium pullulans TaxID=5580 RepID=A0A4S9APT7_AURPU|nr:hypothetical protein D6D15_10476 [Aureobasidium pullulans]
MLYQSQRCIDQLCLLASETNKRIEPIRRQQKLLEAEMGKVKRSLQSSSEDEDRFYLNPGFIRSVEPLLKALDSCMKLRVESDKGAYNRARRRVDKFLSEADRGGPRNRDDNARNRVSEGSCYSADWAAEWQACSKFGRGYKALR